MASIKKITDNISQLSAVVKEYSIALNKEPQNFSLKITIDNLKSQIDDLQSQLYQENLKREKEIVQLRFKGKVARFGTFPLALVGGLTSSFSNAIFNTSKYFQFGNKGGVKIDTITNETIDLRLEGLGKGSTIFYLSAKTSPDLFGNSIIQSSLDNVFDLLNSENPEQIIDNILIVGSKSIKYFSDFFEELNKDDLELDLTWHTPNETVKSWAGTKEKILSLYNTLNSIKLSEPEEINFEGEIITLSLKGRFEILSIDKERFYGIFPNELMEQIKLLHVGDLCKGTILKTIIFNIATGKEKYEYTLRDIII
ncbi:MAG: hypothetical protein RL108_644 [Bacteroidota bacterium]|jgi:hypothetical protein